MKSPPEILEYIDTVPHEHFFRVLDFFNKEIVILTDPKAMACTFQTDAYSYNKGVNAKKILETILGNGLVNAEGTGHKVGLLLNPIVLLVSDSILVPKETPRSGFQFQGCEESVSSFLEQEFRIGISHQS
jgi:hypothetical protein